MSCLGQSKDGAERGFPAETGLSFPLARRGRTPVPHAELAKSVAQVGQLSVNGDNPSG